MVNIKSDTMRQGDGFGAMYEYDKWETPLPQGTFPNYVT